MNRPKDLSIHDNRLEGYIVDCINRTITLRTIFDGPDSIDHTNIVFSDVQAYSFLNDCFGTILFCIDEQSLDDALPWLQVEFENGREWGWPGPWNQSSSAAEAHLRDHSMKVFHITSSIGLEGWCIAKVCSFEKDKKSS
jgi:hypothetical protein